MVTTSSRRLVNILEEAARLFPEAFAEERFSAEAFFRDIGDVLKPIVKHIDGPVKKDWHGPNDYRALPKEHKINYYDFRGVVVARKIAEGEGDDYFDSSGYVIVLARSGGWILLEESTYSSKRQSWGYEGKWEVLDWDPVEVMELFNFENFGGEKGPLPQKRIVEEVVDLLKKEAENRLKRLKAIEARQAAMEAALAVYKEKK